MSNRRVYPRRLWADVEPKFSVGDVVESLAWPGYLWTITKYLEEQNGLRHIYQIKLMLPPPHVPESRAPQFQTAPEFSLKETNAMEVLALAHDRDDSRAAEHKRDRQFDKAQVDAKRLRKVMSTSKRPRRRVKARNELMQIFARFPVLATKEERKLLFKETYAIQEGRR